MYGPTVQTNASSRGVGLSASAGLQRCLRGPASARRSERHLRGMSSVLRQASPGPNDHTNVRSMP